MNLHSVDQQGLEIGVIVLAQFFNGSTKKNSNWRTEHFQLLQDCNIPYKRFSKWVSISCQYVMVNFGVNQVKEKLKIESKIIMSFYYIVK